MIDAKHISFEHLIIDENKVLGEGPFGKVCAGTYFQNPVALKILGSKRDHATMDEFKRRAKVQLQVSKIPGVLSTYDVNYTAALGPVCHLLESADGSLYDYLYRYKTEKASSGVKAYLDLSLPGKLHAIVSIARTLATLEAAGITHGNLKSTNILITLPSLEEEGKGKVSSTTGGSAGDPSNTGGSAGDPSTTTGRDTAMPLFQLSDFKFGKGAQRQRIT
jgi:serine/threonine protein kinase